jgi:hypothetical protein
MRRLTPAAALAIAVVLAGSGCSPRPAVLPEESGGDLLSVVSLDDPGAAAQLVRGFWQLESNAWRWTAGRFSVVLRPPAGAAAAGARLQLKFSLPQLILDKLGPVNLSAAVNGYALDSKSYAEPGDHVYEALVPAPALAAEGAVVEFATDKALPPTSTDNRELALVATSIGLLAK